MNNNKNSIFNQIGGMPAVDAAVGIFYKKILADDRVNHFFKNVDMDEQSPKLKAFLAYAFGAPMAYTGKSMRQAHAHMRITDNHFQVVAMHLADTLKELQVPDELIQKVMYVAGSVKDQIVTQVRLAE